MYVDWIIYEKLTLRKIYLIYSIVEQLYMLRSEWFLTILKGVIVWRWNEGKSRWYKNTKIKAKHISKESLWLLILLRQ